MQSQTRSGGFASMESDKQREIARKGGMAAHRKGTAHEFTAEEARNAGRKGGQQVSVNRSHMIEIGRLGGRRSAERRRNRQQSTGEAPVHAQTSDSSSRQPQGDTLSLAQLGVPDRFEF
jgi:general stress protein YciG